MSLSYLHETKKSMANWSELCTDMLGVIVDKFSAIKDVVHFGAVCQRWRSVPIKKWHFSISDPWLMLAEKEDSDTRGFYSLSADRVCHLNLPEARGKKCFSSCGWLLTLGLDLKIHLLNPFARFSIELPPQPTLPDQYEGNVTPEYIRRIFIQKVILSSRPFHDGAERCVVMVIYCQFAKLAFLRLGDEVWTTVNNSRSVFDVVYFNGQFYAITFQGNLLIVDISGPEPEAIEFAEPPEDINIDGQLYLVESVGELLLLAQDIFQGEDIQGEDVHDWETTGFDVYKFNFDNRTWTQVESLDNSALFVGFNSSFAFTPGREPNRIYFTDVDMYGLMVDSAGRDMGVFEMETGEINRIDEQRVGPDIVSRVCAPLWICP